MTTPAAALQRWLPDIDSRAWIMMGLAALFAVLFLKDAPLPVPWLLAGAVVLAVVWRGQAEIPLYVLVAYLPFSKLLKGWLFGVDVTLVLLGWLLATHVVQCRLQRRPLFRLTAFHIAAGLFIGLSVVSFLRTGRYGRWFMTDNAESFLWWILPVLVGVVASWVVQDRRTLYTVVTVLMVTVAIVALITVYEGWDLAGKSFNSSRAKSIAGQTNILGSFITSYMFVFLGLFLMFPRRRMLGWGPLLAFFLCGRAIMFTFSRGAYLGLAAGGLAACWFRNKWLCLAAAAVGVLLIAQPAFLPAGVRYRLEMITAGESHRSVEASSAADATKHLEPSVTQRLDIWRGAVRMIQTHPWWGVGYGAFTQFIAHYTNGNVTGLNAHNTVLMIAAENGVFAAAAFLSLLVIIFVSAGWLSGHAQDPLMRAIGIGVAAGVVGMLVANQFTVCLRSQEVASYFWILGGLMVPALALERR